MAAAVSTVFKTGIALAGAGAIAMSPLMPTQNAPVPTINLPAVDLTAASVPAIGAIPYQIGVNTVGNLLALAPIILGSTGQCTACLGPVSPPSPSEVPFTGWGLLGIGAGLLSSPIVFVGALGDGSVAKALGAALLAIQVPIQNTFNLLGAPRTVGGFALQAVLDRAFAATKHAVDYLVNIAAQALVTGPLTVLGGAVTGATTFAATLAQTGDFVTAFNAGRVPFEAAVNSALTDLTAEVQEARTTVYTDLAKGPGVATSPIPVVPPPVTAARPAAAELTSGPVTKVTDSVKTVPGTAAGSPNSTGSGGAAAAAGDEGSSAGGSKASTGTGSTKREHKAD